MSGDVSASTWQVEIQLGEHDGRTRAVARLRTHDRTALVGTGLVGGLVAPRAGDLFQILVDR